MGVRKMVVLPARSREVTAAADLSTEPMGRIVHAGYAAEHAAHHANTMHHACPGLADTTHTPVTPPTAT